MQEHIIRRQLEARNENQKREIQAFYDLGLDTFWFLVHDTVLVKQLGENARCLRDLNETEILEFFRESILPTY